MVRVGLLPFRLLALRHGADLVYTEEIIDKKLLNAKRVVNQKLGTIDFVNKNDNSIVLRIAEEEKEFIVCQIGSSNPATALKAAKIIENDVESIDVNMGCPEHFSVHAGMGSGLLKRPKTARSILEELTKNVSVPISCKVRLLPKLKDSLNFMKLMQSAGIHQIGVHSRTREEMSRGFAHWSTILEAKQDPELTIPVLASGDCFSVKDAFELRRYTQCDGILIARGACHNPYIFNDIKSKWDEVAREFNETQTVSELYDEHK
uniref:DUS-like FMN-binding domain-containing protein n=2 Tax=Euplotes harpa TaxID=151035 RepID=A0A7S3J3P4_9SPIT|mmetsp:Transcript_15133/g.17530  ORF Transcript_15133/g.17530 Transcript_15133/m.17530 type:complete len:262 (+) Transcript_15133:46-831(+)